MMNQPTPATQLDPAHLPDCQECDNTGRTSSTFGDDLGPCDCPWRQEAPASLPTVPPTVAITPAIGAPYMGGLYAGLTIADGNLAQLVLLPDAGKGLTWDEAVIWANTVNGELPTRQELVTLYQNLKSEFKPGWHWSGRQHEASAVYAWDQDFDEGRQGYNHKSFAGRARAVRRLPIHQ